MNVDIVETNLDFSSLSKRSCTDMIVIHHTGSPDMDASAEQIHGWHLNNGWAGIGYHYVIRKNGTIERGRPEWAVGSHAYGENDHTIGVHLSGDFLHVAPTDEQIEKCAMLIASLSAAYGIPIDREHVVGHGELMATDCPGVNLQALLDDGTITGKANWYRYGNVSQDKAADKTLPEERIWQFLKGKGLSDYAAAGIMGNLYAESGLIPTNLEDYYECKLGMSDDEYTCAVDAGEYPNFVHDRAGYGLAQWTYYSRKAGLLKYARAKGKSIGDLDMQLEFLWQELQLNQSLMDKLAEAGSVQEASNAVLFDFERPADQSEAVQSIRAGYGQDYYDDFALTNKLVMEEEESMRYNNVAEVPEWAQPTIQKMIDKGLLGGTSGKDNLDLTLEMIRVFVVNDRAGLY
ncbi:putative phage N-acetylmuramoyl-L-alanine amidase [Selenomonas ruminantium subsp. lactilytica TAM6421]|uniref:Putative phage N-acetylmuramoyl-L-alanine amidase n=1 Tax=Selenomonas ruminantium subsp. lactilytica (strain NBRC 103574 / TAM6421) TaxID=927704 RepID=I0GQ13_SELRL|nr:putative phage N-acetylmuramoyl-L-alanine amidase [Selenomonas ruminantium subsp. lactilytica TAM6421]